MIHNVDSTQGKIVEALEKCGASIWKTDSRRKGVPDLVVGVRHRNFLLEVKSEKGKLTPDQVKWHKKWSGQIATVRTVEEALIVCGLTRTGWSKDAAEVIKINRIERFRYRINKQGR